MSYLSNLLGDSYKEGMTEEEISAALERAEIGAPAEINNLKKLLSKANSDAANLKKQLRDKMTDDEAAQLARQDLIDENNKLKRSIALSEKKAKLISLGYDEPMADATAAAMVDGDMETVMTNQSAFLEAQKKVIRADLMKETPRPGAGGGSKSVNPFAKDTFNMTEQGRLLKSDPVSAKALAEAAGVII